MPPASPSTATIQLYAKQFPMLLTTPNPKGHVELLETIGKGNYGYVYKARMIKDKSITAVKVVYLKEDEIKETLLEMEMLKACSHKNITSFMGCFLKGLDFWICMEYCGGGAIDSVYRAFKKPLSEDQISCILYDTAIALDYLHTKAALIHRDIKAGNLLLTENGELKLADFGVSAKLESPGSCANTFIGTPYWMAPEVIRMDPESLPNPSDAYNYKADIWSLGITAIEIAEKNPPLSDIHPMRALYLIPKSELGFAKPKNWSKNFVDFVSLCLTKDPSKRPSAAELLQHPFLSKAKDLPRQQIMKDLADKAKLYRENRKLGKEVEEEEQGTEKNATLKFTQGIKHAMDTLQGTLIHNQSHNTAPVELPTFENKLLVSDAILQVICFEDAIKWDINCADVLDGQYALLGGERGLFFIDLKDPEYKALPLIQGVRYLQLQVLEDYGVLIALSGKHDHIRQYSLCSLRKLIRYSKGESVQQLQVLDLSWPNEFKDSDEQGETGEEDSESLVDEVFATLKQENNREEAVIVDLWISDYIKIAGTRDTKEFLIQRSATSVFMLSVFKQDITLFQWAAEPYSKFMKLKAFWLPEKPKFLKLFHDGISIKEICVGYRNEANLVMTEDSKVVDIAVHRDFIERTSSSQKRRWRNISQIPFSVTKMQELKTLRANPATVNRKLLAASGPTLKRPINHEVDRFFLSTFDRLTYVTDLAGMPLIGSGVGGWKDGVFWHQVPNHLILRPTDHVIGLTDNTIEVFDWSSASKKQVIFFENASLRHVSDRLGGLLVLAERKRRQNVLYWFKESASPTVLKREVMSPIRVLSPLMNQLSLNHPVSYPVSPSYPSLHSVNPQQATVRPRYSSYHDSMYAPSRTSSDTLSSVNSSRNSTDDMLRQRSYPSSPIASRNSYEMHFNNGYNTSYVSQRPVYPLDPRQVPQERSPSIQRIPVDPYSPQMRPLNTPIYYQNQPVRQVIYRPTDPYSNHPNHRYMQQPYYSSPNLYSREQHPPRPLPPPQSVYQHYRFRPEYISQQPHAYASPSYPVQHQPQVQQHGQQQHGKVQQVQQVQYLQQIAPPLRNLENANTNPQSLRSDSTSNNISNNSKSEENQVEQVINLSIQEKTKNNDK